MKYNPKKSILITGGAGFIGSSFIKYILKKYSDYKIINIDKLTYCGNLKNLQNMEKKQLYKFINGDITNESFIKKIIDDEKIKIVINFAAESDVDRAAMEADQCINTNINGVRTLLDSCRQTDIEHFIQISADKVYGNIENGFADEAKRLNPSNIYAVSKAAADLTCMAYYSTFNIPVSIVRLCNNFGPYQFPEKLIPFFITNILINKKIPVFNQGKNIRAWIYVEDTCSAIETVMNKGKKGEIYNISTDNLLTNLDLTKKILNFMKKTDSCMEFTENHPKHDIRYAMNSEKIKKLGWSEQHNFDEALEFTINWYKKNPNWYKPLLNKVKK